MLHLPIQVRSGFHFATSRSNYTVVFNFLSKNGAFILMCKGCLTHSGVVSIYFNIRFVPARPMHSFVMVSRHPLPLGINVTLSAAHILVDLE